MRLRNKNKDVAKRKISPFVNIYEEGDNIILEAEMPGLDKNDIVVEVEGDKLSIRGTHKRQAVPKGYTPIYQEIVDFDYERDFILSEDIDKNNITAQYNDGILTLVLPKSSEAKLQKIEIT